VVVAMTLDEQQVGQRAERVETLLERVESVPDSIRSSVVELLQALLELYGEGLARIVAAVDETGDTGLRHRLTDDDLVSYLLLLHGLHPLDLATRVRLALDRVRPQLAGGDAELVDVTEGVVRLRLSGSAPRSSGAKLRAAVERAAPEADRVEITEAAPAVLIPVASLSAGLAAGGGIPDRR
jgi:Fe-S cluster biogenesis protein NfuA